MGGGTAKRIFISKSSRDAQFALQLRDQLEQRHFATWISEHDIPLGETHQNEIVRVIRDSCSVFVVLVSDASMSSDDVLTEFNLAGKYHVPRLPIIIDESVDIDGLPDAWEYNLSAPQVKKANSVGEAFRLLSEWFNSNPDVDGPGIALGKGLGMMRVTAGVGGTVVNPRSRARQDLADLLAQCGIDEPLKWDRSGLLGCRRAAHALPDVARRSRLSSSIDELLLAQSAQELISRIVPVGSMTKAVLREGRFAAAPQWIIGPEGLDEPEFDRLHDLASGRVGDLPNEPLGRLIKFVARVATLLECADKLHLLREWASEQGLDDSEINHLIAAAQEARPERRLLIDLRGVRQPDGAFPDEATAFVYAPTDGNRILERLPDETVTPATPAGALAAIARCAANAAGRFDAVDVLLPESLLLLEPEDAILADARRKIALGAIHQVALRFGGRISPWTNWDLLFSTCARIQHDDPSPLWLEVPDLDDYDGVIDRVAEHGRGVAFVTPPRSSNGTPSEALVGALSESPVVVWPLTEPPEGHDLQGYVTTHWKSLFVEVAEARRKLRRPGSHMAEPHSCLRVAWEDSEWLKFAQWYTREMVGQ